MLTATIAGAAVSRRGAEYRYAPGARALFDFLQTEDGLRLIDPGTSIEEHRYGVERPCERCAVARTQPLPRRSLGHAAVAYGSVHGRSDRYTRACAATAAPRAVRSRWQTTGSEAPTSTAAKHMPMPSSADDSTTRAGSKYKGVEGYGCMQQVRRLIAKVACRFQYKGVEGYTCMPVADIPGLGACACPNAVWADIRTLTMLSFPCTIPEDATPPQAKDKRAYLNVTGIVLSDCGKGRVRLDTVMWLDIAKGDMSVPVHLAWHQGFDERLQAHCAQARAAAPAQAAAPRARKAFGIAAGVAVFPWGVWATRPAASGSAGESNGKKVLEDLKEKVEDLKEQIDFSKKPPLAKKEA
jgi:hypothetical protein